MTLRALGTTTLDPRRYTDPAEYDREVERIFRREWIAIAREDEIAKPGDYVAFELFGEPLVAVRGDDGVWAIDNYYDRATTAFVSYYKGDMAEVADFDCLTEDEPDPHNHLEGGPENIPAGDVLRTFRLAVTTTTQYNAQHGNTVPTDACTGACRNNVCGDGVVFTGVEECDNGAANSDTAPNACRTTCLAAACGDDVVDSGEECDGSSATACVGGEVCNAACDCQGAAQECPAFGELTVLAGHGKTCLDTSECEAGECIDGRCRTATRLDTGLTGIAHDSDITDDVTVRGFLDCGDTFPCGVCQLNGIDPSPGYCRCANNNQVLCDQPFAADTDDCGGQLCHCYFGPPLALSAGNTPACVVNRFRQDVTGTANVDLGAGEVTAKLSSIVHLGISTIRPCT